MQIYQSRPAPQKTASWLLALLQPVIEACHFESPIPLEIRPCGKWGGFCDYSDHINDRRVYLSSKVFFWERRAIVSMYLHECCHRILGHEHDHDAVFFALQYLLFLRVDALHNITLDPNLYDAQDVDSTELGASIDWAIQAATTLASSTKTVEQCATLLIDQFQKFITDYRAATQKAEKAARQRAALIDQWRAKRDFWQLWAMCATGLALVALLALFIYF